MIRRNLSKEKICQEAIELISIHGVEQLSMRNLANRLNIKAASLYNHIANKRELLDSLQDILYARFNIEIRGSTWQDVLYNLAIDSRVGLLAIPSMVFLFATRPMVGKVFLIHAEKILQVLINAGFDYSEVIPIYRNLYVFILGHVLAEVGVLPGEKDARNESSLKKINLENYPILYRAYSNPLDFDSGFKTGLNALVAGFEQQLKQKPTKL